MTRREWLRARLVAYGPKEIILEHTRVYMSDGTILQRVRPARASWWPWKKRGAWDLAKPLDDLRRELVAIGWEPVPIRQGSPRQMAGAR
jgi:hypothetical protein